MNYRIGIDIGTTSIKVVLYDEELEARASSNIGYATYHELPGYAEQDPLEILQAFKDALREVLEKSGVDRKRVSLLSFSSAMHSLILVDQDHKPLTRSIIWSDNRSVTQVEEFRRQEDWLAHYGKTGTPIHSMSPFFKLKWFGENTDLLQAARKALGIKEFILHHLTGDYVVDYSIASATGLFNIHDLGWDSEALAYLGIEEELLSRPVDVTSRLPVTDQDFLMEMGLPQDLSLMVGASDGCLANLGSFAQEKGETVLTIGTSGAIRMTVDKPLLDPAGRIFCYYLSKDRWVIGGAVNNGGNVLSWLDGILYEKEGGLYEALSRAAGSVPPGSEGLLFIPYLNGERAPHWDGSLSASFLGAAPHHEKRHFLRAALEGMAFNLREVWSLLEELGGRSTNLKVNGGFLRSSEWSGILADVFGRDLLTLPFMESSCLGAVLLDVENPLDSSGKLQSKLISPNEVRCEEYRRLYSKYRWFSERIIAMEREARHLF